MNEKYMLLAIEEAKKSLKENEIPVGAVVVYDNKVIAKAHNKKEKLKCATKHAEIIAIEKASKKINNWRLIDCDIYVTLEPCPMCASAIKQSRINNVYCGLKSKDKENSLIVEKIFDNNYSNSKINYSCGYFSLEIEKLVNIFFKNKRN